MSFRYQGSSPWAAGAPPQSYGAPPLPPQHHHQQPQHHTYGAPAYGSPQVAPSYGYGRQMGPAQGMNAPVPPAWGQGPVGAPPMVANQRGNMRPMSGPTGKRGGGQWHDNPPNKRMNRGNRGNQGNWQGGNRRDGRKFDNRNAFAKDNRRNQGKGKPDQSERRQQHDQAQKAAESLEKKEYSIVANDTAKDDEKNKGEDIDPAQARYVLAVFGYCCKLCDVFLRDKGASLEHCQNEQHMEKFNAAEEERLKKEKEEAEKKAAEEKAKNEVNDKGEEESKEQGDKDETADEQADTSMNGVDDSKHGASALNEINTDTSELGKDEESSDTQVDTKDKSEELVAESNDVKVDNKEEVETPCDDPQNETTESADIDETGDEIGENETPTDSPQKTAAPAGSDNSPRGGVRGGQRNRGPGRGGGARGRGNRARGGARGRR